MEFRFSKQTMSGTKGRPLLWSHYIEDLESEFVASTYALHEAEDQVLSSANRPDGQQQAVNNLVSNKKKIFAIEVAIRRLRHGY